MCDAQGEALCILWQSVARGCILDSAYMDIFPGELGLMATKIDKRLEKMLKIYGSAGARRIIERHLERQRILENSAEIDRLIAETKRLLNIET